jgi:pimeloyl-ACP methyl ester carboxylesterase
VASVSTVDLSSGLTLSYARQGIGRRAALVLLPGPTDSWRSYQPVLAELPPALHAIAVSMRGHGDSDKPETGYRVEDFAADVVAFLDAVGIERAVLTGHSGSCLVARRIALDHPERVAGLILEASPTTLRGDARLQELVESVVSRLEDPISPDVARSFVVDTSSDDVTPEFLDELVEEVLKVPARVWKQMFGALLDYDDVEGLPRIDAPTLLVWGDIDSLISRDMQDQLARRIPVAELVVYGGAGHTPRWDDPSRFSRDVSAFVAELLTPGSTGPLPSSA